MRVCMAEGGGLHFQWHWQEDQYSTKELMHNEIKLLCGQGKILRRLGEAPPLEWRKFLVPDP